MVRHSNIGASVIDLKGTTGYFTPKMVNRPTEVKYSL